MRNTTHTHARAQAYLQGHGLGDASEYVAEADAGEADFFNS
jgi:hypothetical protein